MPMASPDQVSLRDFLLKHSYSLIPYAVPLRSVPDSLDLGDLDPRSRTCSRNSESTSVLRATVDAVLPVWLY
ncbi:hypothetical protein GUJ93_ZPchr0009g1134 [Zizania palustris]|uniref:Uncharacterized protein n=1 Tax=Zizania palustris TaxID=103762 RepID=A0A8J5S6S4_ZIZPA|nr:hypothetical protein GUJ93_ZPchr0009g1134 [Zizania palustris]